MPYVEMKVGGVFRAFEYFFTEILNFEK